MRRHCQGGDGSVRIPPGYRGKLPAARGTSAGGRAVATNLGPASRAPPYLQLSPKGSTASDRAKMHGYALAGIYAAAIRALFSA